jgi:hypothetical protein
MNDEWISMFFFFLFAKAVGLTLKPNQSSVAQEGREGTRTGT